MSRKIRIRRKRPKRRLRKRFIFILIPLIIVIAVGGYFTHLYSKAESVVSSSHKDFGRDKSALRDEKVDPLTDNISILIIGVDASETRHNVSNHNSRSDTLILATLNVHDKSVKLTSIPRDSYVSIPGKSYKTKINAAHAYGGPMLTMETVEDLLNVPVDYYVRVNFDAFMDVVNAIDGITVDVPYEMHEQNSKDKADAIHLLPGVQKLDGEQALAFARTRKKDSDIQRGGRQQEVIQAVFHKATSFSTIWKFDDVMEAVGANMTTNMQFKDMKSLVSYALHNKSLNFDTNTLKGSDYKPGRVYYYKLDEQALAKTQYTLRKQLELPTPNASQFEDEENDTTSNYQSDENGYTNPDPNNSNSNSDGQSDDAYSNDYSSTQNEQDGY